MWILKILVGVVLFLPVLAGFGGIIGLGLQMIKPKAPSMPDHVGKPDKLQSPGIPEECFIDAKYEIRIPQPHSSRMSAESKFPYIAEGKD